MIVEAQVRVRALLLLMDEGSRFRDWNAVDAASALAADCRLKGGQFLLPLN